MKKAPSFPVSIFIAGDYARACDVCREICDAVGLCVTVTPTEYVYTDGQESGVIVGLINYPRFPTEPEKIEARAVEVGHELMRQLGQQSFSVQTPVQTLWFSIRPGDAT